MCFHRKVSPQTLTSGTSPTQPQRQCSGCLTATVAPLWLMVLHLETCQLQSPFRGMQPLVCSVEATQRVRAKAQNVQECMRTGSTGHVDKVLHGDSSKPLATHRNTKNKKHLQSTQSAQPTNLTDQTPSTMWTRCQSGCTTRDIDTL